MNGFNIEFYDCDKSGDFNGIKKSNRITKIIKDKVETFSLFDEVEKIKNKNKRILSHQ